MSEKLADITELHRLGILQEANRLFFHPLGLAMVWELPREDNPEDATTPRIVGFWDARADPEGWWFTDLSDTKSHQNAEQVDALRARFTEVRTRLVGSSIQPLGDKRP